MHEALMSATGGGPPEGIDAVFVGCMNPDEFTGDGNLATLVTDHLGIRSAPSMRIDNAPASGSAAFEAGYLAVASGRYDNVLVLAGEKMSGVPTAEAIRVLSKMIDRTERDLGATLTALAALVARRYMHDYGLSREDLARVAVKNHANGAKNPFAQFQKEVSLEKVLESRMISDPLRLYDCASICDGAAAAFLTSEQTGVQVTGLGHATDYVPVQLRDSLTSLHATKVAGERAYAMAGRKPVDIDVAEIHDAFSILEIINSEDLGFFPPGEGGKALAEGRTGMGGDMPINPSGGLKARGHPVGATGLAQICEIVWQLRGEAGDRQVADAKVGLCHNIGGFGNNNVVTILEGRA
jgi:acetyl-CoA C-acetyltransferase